MKISTRRAIVIMGVTGSGKSTVGRALSESLGLPFLEGDDFHPAANIAKMSAGIPLTDEDREPWLTAIGDRLRSVSSMSGAVVSCSALKRSYRDRIRSRAQTGVAFTHLCLDHETLQTRMAGRQHFMPVTLLASQLATLEPPGVDEDALTIDAALPTGDQIAIILKWLAISPEDQPIHFSVEVISNPQSRGGDTAWAARGRQRLPCQPMSMRRWNGCVTAMMRHSAVCWPEHPVSD